ncbi:unnamed protein product [Symbiodinium sp. CCMP2592]|nr:unnamed protein product [Symbiodinium sp. CCMP2592]
MAASAGGKVLLLESLDPIDIPMVRYLLDHCSDGKKAGGRCLMQMTTIQLVVAVSLFCLLAFSLPLPRPSEGLWANWVFLVFTHPALNYIAAWFNLKQISRALPRQERVEFEHRLPVVALILPCLCALIHIAFYLAGFFPTPVSIFTSCVPAGLSTSIIAIYLSPGQREVLVRSTVHMHVIMILLFVQICFHIFQWRAFPYITALEQSFSVVLVSLVPFVLSRACVAFGDRLCKLPRKYLEESKIHFAFLSFLFSALLMSSARNLTAVMVIVMVDAAKALFTGLGLLEKTTQVCFGPRHSLKRRIEQYHELLQRLKFLHVSTKSMKSEQLWDVYTTPIDAETYLQFSTGFVNLAVVELCELMVPVIFIFMYALFSNDVLGANRNYFLLYADEGGDESMVNGIMGNLVALSVEAFVFSVLELATRVGTGFSIFYFASFREND